MGEWEMGRMGVVFLRIVYGDDENGRIGENGRNGETWENFKYLFLLFTSYLLHRS